MNTWKIRQAIDLARGGSAPQVWPHALMVPGDRKAHTWEITVCENGQPVDLTGATVAAYFNRPDNQAVRVSGSATGNVAAVTFAPECYAYEGPLLGFFRLTTDGATLTVSVLRFVVGAAPYGSIIAPGLPVQNLDDLVAQIEAMEQAAAAANDAVAIVGTFESRISALENAQPVVDSTLTVPWQPAEAKAAGDRIRALEATAASTVERVETLENLGLYLVDGLLCVEVDDNA